MSQLSVSLENSLIFITCYFSKMDNGILTTTKDRMMQTGDKDPATLLDRAMTSPTHCTTQ